MTETKDFTCQRKSKRFRVDEQAYALLKQPHYTELGKIIDISKTGISFLCINEGDWSDGPFEIDILIGNDHQHIPAQGLNMLRNIPLQPVIYSTDSSTSRGVDFMKRCGVQFGELNNDQKAHIDAFILRYTCGNA